MKHPPTNLQTSHRFEHAADAVVTGDEALLRQLLRDDPTLVQARSAEPHHATLLHYVAANGVETAARPHRPTP